MLDTAEFDHQRTDYILGLMSRNQEQVFEQHLKDCPECQHEVALDRKIVMMTRQTLQAAPTISAARLKALQPPIPRKRQAAGWANPLFIKLAQPVLAGVVMFMIALGSLTAIGSPAPAMAATSTSTMTATATHLPTAVATTAQEGSPLGFFVEASATPAPPTPIAQLLPAVPLETQPSPYENE